MYYAGAESTPSVMTIASAAGGGDISHILKANNTRVEKFLKKIVSPLVHSFILQICFLWTKSFQIPPQEGRSQSGPKGRQLELLVEVGAWRAPRLLVFQYFCLWEGFQGHGDMQRGGCKLQVATQLHNISYFFNLSNISIFSIF